mmetsp:Transcript_26403/g.87543  ORF Transcript_26403/g.87543 Transcript_26403/m.87543 type:complete len:212 (-) Transcript_26403:197-832(-)
MTSKLSRLVGQEPRGGNCGGRVGASTNGGGCDSGRPQPEVREPLLQGFDFSVGAALRVEERVENEGVLSRGLVQPIDLQHAPREHADAREEEALLLPWATEPLEPLLWGIDLSLRHEQTQQGRLLVVRLAVVSSGHISNPDHPKEVLAPASGANNHDAAIEKALSNSVFAYDEVSALSSRDHVLERPLLVNDSGVSIKPNHVRIALRPCSF